MLPAEDSLRRRRSRCRWMTPIPPTSSPGLASALMRSRTRRRASGPRPGVRAAHRDGFATDAALAADEALVAGRARRVPQAGGLPARPPAGDGLCPRALRTPPRPCSRGSRTGRGVSARTAAAPKPSRRCRALSRRRPAGETRGARCFAKRGNATAQMRFWIRGEDGEQDRTRPSSGSVTRGARCVA